MTLTVTLPEVREVSRVPSVLTTLVGAEDKRTVVVLSGDADLSARPALAGALSRVIALTQGDVVIDLAEVGFIDTATVRALAMAQQLLADHGRALVFRSPSRLATRMLTMFGLTAMIEAPIGAQS